MLKNFLYLNTSTVDGYLSSLEGGLRATAERTTGGSAGAGGKVSLGPASASADKGVSHQEKIGYEDTPEARFDRLRELASDRADDTGWMRVVNPDIDLQNLPNGAIIDIDCEIDIPDAIKMLSRGKNAVGLIETVSSLASSAEALGIKTDNMPDASQLSAMSSMLGALQTDLALVGEQDDTEWRIAGRLDSAFVRGDVEGFATVIGKVNRQVTAGKWAHLLAIPGMDVISRAQRRELEKRGPGPGQDGTWLPGPALILDVVAVFR